MGTKNQDDTHSRRHFCRGITAAAVAATAIGSSGSTPLLGDEKNSTLSTAVDDYPTNAEQAIERLFAGNQRFVEGKIRHPHESKDWRRSLEAGQHPYAVVLGCADSRVCPEIVFDQGLGDLFVIRVAGNIVDVDVTASVEYAVSHLNTKLVVVLGHSNCGAVTATLDHLTDSANEPDEIVSLLYRIEPALAGLPKDLSRKELISLAVRKNVEFSARRLTRVPHLRRATKTNGLRVVGAVYDMHTGKIQMLPR